MVTIALITLVHVLVFVYWLGGDLGAFYSSQYLTRLDVTPENRLLAATIVNNVDMAPRSALILMLPTGLLLAQLKSWISPSNAVLAAICVLSIAWLAIVWTLHTKSNSALKQIDNMLRYGLVIALIAAATSDFIFDAPIPLFISLKMLCLAGCVVLGLLIRHWLEPLGSALAGIMSDAPEQHELSLKQTLEKVRPLVVGIWILLISAAFLGIWAPTT